MLKNIRAFLNGAKEFRTDFTTSYDDPDTLDWYDRGRDMAHRLTFRRYDY